MAGVFSAQSQRTPWISPAPLRKPSCVCSLLVSGGIHSSEQHWRWRHQCDWRAGQEATVWSASYNYKQKREVPRMISLGHPHHFILTLTERLLCRLVLCKINCIMSGVKKRSRQTAYLIDPQIKHLDMTCRLTVRMGRILWVLSTFMGSVRGAHRRGALRWAVCILRLSLCYSDESCSSLTGKGCMTFSKPSSALNCFFIFSPFLCCRSFFFSAH